MRLAKTKRSLAHEGTVAVYPSLRGLVVPPFAGGNRAIVRINRRLLLVFAHPPYFKVPLVRAYPPSRVDTGSLEVFH